ncbi:MAG: hypothetical protein SOH81_08350, partial [Acetobacter sp.]
MKRDDTFEIFMMAPPGLENVLCEEVRLKGFRKPVVVPGGVVTRGHWPDVWRANLWIRDLVPGAQAIFAVSGSLFNPIGTTSCSDVFSNGIALQNNGFCF